MRSAVVGTSRLYVLSVGLKIERWTKGVYRDWAVTSRRILVMISAPHFKCFILWMRTHNIAELKLNYINKRFIYLNYPLQQNVFK